MTETTKDTHNTDNNVYLLIALLMGLSCLGGAIVFGCIYLCVDITTTIYNTCGNSYKLWLGAPIPCLLVLAVTISLLALFVSCCHEAIGGYRKTTLEKRTGGQP